ATWLPSRPTSLSAVRPAPASSLTAIRDRAGLALGVACARPPAPGLAGEAEGAVAWQAHAASPATSAISRVRVLITGLLLSLDGDLPDVVVAQGPEGPPGPGGDSEGDRAVRE